MDPVTIRVLDAEYRIHDPGGRLVELDRTW